MNGSCLYHVAQYSEHAVGRNRVMLCVHQSGDVIEADAATSRLLHLCQGARTIDGHVQWIARVTSAPEQAIKETLEALAEAGLLQSTAGARLQDPPHDESRSIETVGIITADRSDTLARGLSDAVAHAARSDHDVCFLVVDGSKDAEHQARTRAAADCLRNQTSITYIGPREVKGIVSRLAKYGFDAARLRLAFEAGTAGANRNLLLLLTAGRTLLMADDDIRWRTWRLLHDDGRVAFGAHADPREAAFFNTRAEAIEAAHDTDADLLAAHGSLLRRTARSLLAREPDLTEACSHLLSSLAWADPPLVRVTLAGLAGDAGTYCPYQWLFAQGPARASLLQSQELFQRALVSRETHRIVARSVVTHDPHCMAGCMGLDNTDLLPPFMPFGRNEDGVFGAMLAFADVRALFAHLPLGIIHDSVRPAMRPNGPITSATQTRLADVVFAMLPAASGAGRTASVAARIQRLARVFSEVGDLSPQDFRGFLKQIVIDGRSRQLLRLDAALSKDGAAPGYWRTAAEAFRNQLLASVIQPEFCCPIECRNVGSTDMCFRATQEFLHDFGELLAIWPDVWARVAEIGSSDLIEAR